MEESMSRHVRWFLFGYTATLILAESSPYFTRSHSDGAWFGYWQVPVAYLVLAVGTFIHKSDELELPNRWLFAVLVLSLSGPVQVCLSVSLESGSIEEALKMFAFPLIYCVLSLAVFSLTPQYFQRTQRPWLNSISVGAAFVGVVLILASLVTQTTENAEGWKILTQKNLWITYLYNGVQNFLEIGLAKRVNWIFALSGWVMYLLMLVDAILIAIWILKLRESNQRLGSSRFFVGLAASSTFLTFWLFTDIFWGWHTALWWSFWTKNSFLPAVVLFLLWLAGPIFGCWLILHSLRNGGGRQTLLTIQALQLPIAVFNFTLVWLLFSGEALLLPGLGLLSVGSQMLTWACIVLLTASEGLQKTSSPVLP
jgi:hypothetical protein